MNPDISYIFNFEKSQKKQAIESLKEFCINTQENNNGAEVKLDHRNGFIETVYTNPHFDKKRTAW